jgi:hypothetical protein
MFNQMVRGHLPELGLRAGFMPASGPQSFMPGAALPESVPIITRGINLDERANSILERMTAIQRGTFSGDASDVQAVLMDLQNGWLELQRAITSTTTAFPVRENLEAEAKVLVPLDTPLRNRTRRVPGSGLASKWKQVLSLGGGYAFATQTNGAITLNVAAQSVAVVSSAGFSVGDVFIIDSGANAEAVTITAIADGTHVTGIFSINHASPVAIVKVNVQPGSPQGFLRMFFAESGAPADHATVYANPTASYKLMGVYGSITQFAMAAGANFQNQLAMEKTNQIRNLMLNEEYALWQASSTSTAAPWGDGTTALGFDGMLNLVSTANGTPPNQIQTAVGAFTTAHIDAQLTRIWQQGGRGLWMGFSAQEALSLTHVMEGSGTIMRYMVGPDGKIVAGLYVGAYVHPISGELVDIIVSRNLPYGTIVFGCDTLPDGSPSFDVDVLPQVALPQLVPNENIQGYTAQEIAPSTTAPQVLPFIVTVYQVPRLKSAIHFGKSTGVTAV